MTVRTFVQRFDVPLAFAYRWCTDFSQSEDERSRAGFERRVLQAQRTQCVFVDLYPAAGGGVRVAVNVVALRPPDAWHLDFFGEPRAEIVDYRLTPRGPRSTDLTMTFRRGLSPTEVRGFRAWWTAWAAEMERDYTARR